MPLVMSMFIMYNVHHVRTEMKEKKTKIIPKITPIDTDQASPTIHISDVNDYSMISPDFSAMAKKYANKMAEVEKRSGIPCAT